MFVCMCVMCVRPQSLEWAIGAVIHFVFIALYLLIWGVDIVQVRTLMCVCVCG